MRHDLKTWPKYYKHIMSGMKTFEIRLNDRDFQLGDTLLLKEWDPENEQYTGAFTEAKVTYVTSYNQRPGYVVMGIRPIWVRGQDEIQRT